MYMTSEPSWPSSLPRSPGSRVADPSSQDELIVRGTCPPLKSSCVFGRAGAGQCNSLSRNAIVVAVASNSEQRGTCPPCNRRRRLLITATHGTSAAGAVDHLSTATLASLTHTSRGSSYSRGNGTTGHLQPGRFARQVRKPAQEGPTCALIGSTTSLPVSSWEFSNFMRNCCAAGLAAGVAVSMRRMDMRLGVLSLGKFLSESCPGMT